MKILFVGEFSQIATGYGKITSELIKRFHKDGYEVAELANFCGQNDPRIKNCDWKVYPNLPSNEEENREYSSNPQNSNGKWKFEDVLLDFMPNFVFGNGDPFFYEYQGNSPLRSFFNWIITAPVDGIPQHNQWIQIFNSADGLTTYTNWGKEVLESYDINVHGVTPPVASNEFFPINQKDIDIFKSMIGVSNKKIIGTVMRNQPRKLFYNLFSSFSKIDNDDILLYCHTTYPDGGWDFSELLLEFDLTSKVLFTYKCKNCNQAYANFFQDLKAPCPFCKKIAAKMPDGQDSVDNKILNRIINIFDVYIQVASREGFGIPQIEAAACDIPIITMDYAGMKDIIKYINAYPIKINDYNLSYPMNMIEAVPDQDSIIENIKLALSDNLKGKGIVRNLYNNTYGSWDNTYNVYKNIIDSLPIKKWEKRQISAPHEYSDMSHLSNEEYVKYLLLYVLNDPSLIGSYLMTRLIKDLNSGITFGGLFGDYFTESTEQRSYQEFNRRIAYDILFSRKVNNDYWIHQLNERLK